MTKEEAIRIASDYVEAQYGTVPPVAILVDTREHNATGEHANKVVVAFKCSWDTDELGLPNKLVIAVDCTTRETQLL
jgi:hypothetical protein